MPMGFRPQKEGKFPNQQEDSAAAWQADGADELKDPHFWSAILPETVALNALLSVPLWSRLFKLAFKAHQSYLFPQTLALGTVREM